MPSIEQQLAELKELSKMEFLDDSARKEIEKAIEVVDKIDKLQENTHPVMTDGKLPIKFINKSSNRNPEYAKVGDSGFDLRSDEGGTLKPLERMLVSTGLYFELPNGYELQVRPRSGLAAKHGVTVLNTPGTVDTGYRGEVKVILVNLSNDTFTFEKGERIAQAVIASRVSSDFGDLIEVTEISDSERGEGGFGSTGTK
jgi:dUTP pyrophosphatase